mmetsp:Transcript_2448/g.8253  ORF Transcript_2448/g.8253 Transcript_2448/m.8253 type:complete len:83 (-) Transcript_2448:857-1105(-)
MALVCTPQDHRRSICTIRRRCESWCSDESKISSKTVDLCNNPLHKENKLSMAKRIINGSLFLEAWDKLDDEVKQAEANYSGS